MPTTLGDLVRAHAVGVRLQVLERLQHGACGGRVPAVAVRILHRLQPPGLLAAPDGAALARSLYSGARCNCAAAFAQWGRAAVPWPAEPRGEGTARGRRCATPGWRSTRQPSPRSARGRFAMPGSGSSAATGRTRSARRSRTPGGARSGAGVDPSASGAAPLVADDDEAAARWEVHPLVTSAPLIRECLAGIADDAAHLMVVSDADGTLLWLEGAPQRPARRGQLDELRRRRAVERGRRGHERDRHRAGRRPRRAGVRRRALQRGRAGSGRARPPRSTTPRPAGCSGSSTSRAG